MSLVQAKSPSTNLFDTKWNEQILVVKRSILFPEGTWQGVKAVNFDAYLSLIKENKEFVSRGPAETNFEYKQIIPYLIFKFQDQFFLMQRQKKASEQRLASKYSLGIGGHLRQEDLKKDDIFEWAKREFYEEVNYKGTINITPLGILNDDSNDVGKVHLGFVLLLEGDNPNISVKSELASGALLSLNQCKAHYSGMETWTQLVFNFLQGF